MPLVSVVMPVRNEAAWIARSLDAVLRQEYPIDRLEILIADGASDDATRAIIASLPGADRVRVLANPRRSQAAGLNLAIAAARGEIIMRVDGHTAIAPDYVSQCVRVLRETGAECVGGPMIPAGVTPSGAAIAHSVASPFGVPSAFRSGTRAGPTDSVYLGAWPREVFTRAGHFDESLPANEDYELNYRLREAGGTVVLHPAIRSTYFGRQALRDLARQYFTYGRGKAAVLRKHPASLRPRQLVAPAFVAFVALGALGAPFSMPARVLWLGVLALYLALATAASAQLLSRGGIAALARAVAAFVVLHTTWGAGFWLGLFQPAPRRMRGTRGAAAAFDVASNGSARSPGERQAGERQAGTSI